MDKKIVEELKKPSSYPYKVKTTDFVETHISWIYLAGDYVYKVKRPVEFSFLDFSTLEKRKEHCENELELNRRLVRDMYLDVVPIVKEGKDYCFEGEGTPIEYAVKMKRMPEEKRMDLLLEKGEVSRADVENIAVRIAKFHAIVRTITDRSYGSPELINEQTEDLKRHINTIEKAAKVGKKAEDALSRCRRFHDRKYMTFYRRQMTGMIKECHGDLHSANVFLVDKPYIFDCIEFNRDFRYIDVASEIAFMAMDLDAFGREDLSRAFVKRYTALTGYREMLTILDYYKCYRANVRAKIAAIEYAQKPNADSKKRIAKYVNLMEKYAKRL